MLTLTKYTLTLIFRIAAALLRLAASLLIALIVALLAVAYLNAAGARRDRVARALLFALGERESAQPSNVPAHWRQVGT